ncbi:DKNYY domain-containing protein [Cellulophaga baltica]|uniref:DKNYY family n=1 Tax=Cellulophaga baltica TaxID=76594 RepID=A0A1G7LWR8_9FLAO|nr:DKNYY domain-containing protein [Cellulophaga baltica]SDF53957.1 DKNYY family [Cellulophaga baltica]
MAEPTGVFIEIEIDEKGLKKMLNHAFDKAYNNKLGYYFSELLYNCNANPGNVFILNYNLKSKKCFIAYLLNHYEKTLVEPLIDALPLISSIKKSDTTDYAIVATIFPEVLESYKITNKKTEKITHDLPADIVNRLINKLWSFSENNSFPEPKKAINKRNYFYKGFKTYYKKYLLHIAETERPSKIAQATEEAPYHLFDNFYTYNNKVYDLNRYTNQIIELPQADPASFRNVAGIKADKNFVFNKKLASNSPPKTIKEGNYSKNNPLAVWEWCIAEGIDGLNFKYIKDKWDTIYWKDKNAVFIYNNNELIKLEHADSRTFIHLDFCYGKDKNQVFYLDRVIPINVNNFELNKNGFIFDNYTIFHYENEIPLDAKTFKILEYESSTNPFVGTFLLEDKNGHYKYNKDWKPEVLLPIAPNTKY